MSTDNLIDFNNLDKADEPSKENEGFLAGDSVDNDEENKLKTAPDDQNLAENPHLKEENKLPPANELAAQEENPEQRKLAGEAPHVTAARPDAFTKEVEGGVVKEQKEGVITGDRKSEEESNPPTTSTPSSAPSK